MKAIPVPVRERIIKLYERGKSTEEIADSFGYCVAAVRRVRQQFRERWRAGTPDPLVRAQDAVDAATQRAAAKA